MLPQHRFLSHQGRPVDRIFRYEDMQRFVDFLEDQLDCAISLPRINVPPTVAVDLDAADEQALRQAMAPDIALYETI